MQAQYSTGRLTGPGPEPRLGGGSDVAHPILQEGPVFSDRVAAVASARGLARRWWAPALVVLLLGALVVQGTLALALQSQQIWNAGLFDDAAPADTPLASYEIFALPCVSARLAPAVAVVGTVPAVLAPELAPPALDASRSRAPPLA